MVVRLATGAESGGGWIKVYRSLLTNGHLQMPDITFKLFMFLLLQVNHSPNLSVQCGAGEGWITYRMIKENCCDPRETAWADSTIARSLKYLEKSGYIQRVKQKNGLAQKIRIVNWHRYQSDTSSLTQEVTLGVALGVPLEGALGVALDKQEGEEGKEGREEDRSMSSAARQRRKTSSQTSSSSGERVTDPFNQAAQPLVRKLDAWRKEQGLEGIGNWAAVVKITANALKGSSAGAPITGEDADAALTWAMDNAYWRPKLKAKGMLLLRDIWGAWTERNTPPGGRPANRYQDPAAEGPKFLPDSPWARTGS